MIDIIYVDVSGVDDETYGKLYALADAQRKVRTQRYLRYEDKVRCVAAGALLRYAVKHCLGVDNFGINTDANGKPYVVGAPGFHFNLSHSGKWVVIAYGDTPVGIDVEEINSGADTQSIAKRFFSPDEQTHVLGCKERFYEIWTAKESYIKYVGKGLQMGLDSFSVLSLKDVRFSPIDLGSGYRMTLCAKESPHTIKQITFKQLVQ